MPLEAKNCRDEIYQTRFPLAIARASFEQAEKAVADQLEIRKSGEAKLTSLFGYMVSLSTAVVGLAGVMSQKLTASPLAFVILVASSCAFMGAAALAGRGLWPSEGAMMGMEDWRFWLSDPASDVECVDREVEASLYALAAYDFADRVQIQRKDNRARQRLTRGVFIAAMVGGSLFILGVSWLFVSAGALGRAAAPA